MLDADTDNATCAAYTGRLPFEVYTPETWRSASARPWTFVLIDAPARPSPDQLEALARSADIIVTPTLTDAASLRVLARTLPDLRRLSAPYRVLITRAPARPSRDTERARVDLERGNVPTFETVIPEAAVFRHAARLLTLAWDVPRVRGSHVRLAFESLAREVMQHADA